MLNDSFIRDQIRLTCTTSSATVSLSCGTECEVGFPSEKQVTECCPPATPRTVLVKVRSVWCTATVMQPSLLQPSNTPQEGGASENIG